MADNKPKSHDTEHDVHLDKDDYEKAVDRVNQGSDKPLDFDVDNLDETQRDAAVAFYQNQPSELNKQEIEMRNALQDVVQDKERAEHVADRAVRTELAEQHARNAESTREHLERDREEAERQQREDPQVETRDSRSSTEVDDARVAHQKQAPTSDKQDMLDNAANSKASTSENEETLRQKAKDNTDVDEKNKDKGQPNQKK